MPERDPYGSLYTLLGTVPDVRDARGRRHHLADVLFITLVGIIAGAEDAQALEDFATMQRDWFRDRCGLRHGIPSQDTYLRVLAALDPRAFGEAFQKWVAELWGPGTAKHVAIDGKTLRRSFDRAAGRSAVHSVAAFASERGLVLGQVTVQDKENEIIAIPKLLQLIDVRGATITIDAMGCQTAIAQAIQDQNAHYVLQVKDNHPTLRGHIEDFFTDVRRDNRPLDDPAPALSEASEVDSGHGRIEERRCLISRDLSWIDTASDWAGLSGIAMLERLRENKVTGESSRERAYFIFSDPDATARRINELIRSHWSIENSLHWVLDVTFNEDQSRIRTANAAENVATLRRAGLNLLRDAPTPPGTRGKVSLRRKRRFSLMNPLYLETVLRIPPSQGS